MSSYDRGRERKRILIIVGVIIAFTGGAFVFGSVAERSMDAASHDAVVSQS